MEIKGIFSILRRRLWIILIGLIIGLLAGLFYSLRQVPIYQASTRFVVMRSAQTTYDYYTYLDAQQLISTYTELLTTERLVNKASEQLGFDVQIGQADASQIGDTQFVRLTVRDTDPQEAAAIANILVRLLIEENEELQAIRYNTAEENLQERIDDAEEKINILQTQYKEISESTVKEQITQVQAQIADIQSKIVVLETRMSSFNEIIATEEQKAQYAQDKIEIDQLYSVLNLYNEIYSNLIVLGKPVGADESKSLELENLQTTLNLYEQIYISSISSLETLRLMRAQNMPNVVQVEIATPPQNPISPKPIQTAIATGLIGVIVTLGILFLIEYLDDTIKSPDDVKKVLGLPVIGVISEMKLPVKEGEKLASGVYVNDQPRSPVSESFRSLRTNLEFFSLDKEIKTILVTSSDTTEGKTTVASNTAIILAQGQKNTLLIDCDLRRPHVHRQFNLSNRIGLSDLIRGRLSFEELICKYEGLDYLSIITSGSLPPNPAEFLGSEKFKKVLDELTGKFDIIIIDSPPMVVSDAQILSSKVDGIIFVIRPGKTHTNIAQSSIENIGRFDAKILGVVLNRVPRAGSIQYGKYKYYSNDVDSKLLGG